MYKYSLFPLILLLVMAAACKKEKIQNTTVTTPQYDFTWSENPVTGSPITFSSNAKETDYFYWDFGNGVTSNDVRPSYTYYEQGDYNVLLVVNGDHQHSVTKTVHVAQRLTITYKGDPIIGDTIFFKSNSSESTPVYEWDFGDGTTSTQPKPYHIFNNTGRMTIKLRLPASNTSATAYITLYKDPVYTYKITGSRLWHIQKRIVTLSSDTSYFTDTSFDIRYINKAEVLVDNKFFSGLLSFNDKTSAGNILVYDGAGFSLKYNYAVDTAYLYKENYTVHNSTGPWTEYTIGRTP